MMGRDSSLQTIQILEQEWKNYKTKHALKHTKQRDFIANVFFHSQHHLSVEDLLQKVRIHHKKIGYVTVYRTLKLLVDAGLAAARQFGDNQTRYEVSGSQTPHHDHFICLQCGLILEFENEKIEKLQNDTAQKLGNFTIIHHKLELYGLCPKAMNILDRSCPAEQQSGKKIPKNKM